MRHKHQINLISDSSGETLDRMFLALKSQFSNFDCEKIYKWPAANVTRKSVEETAATIIKIFDIKKGKKNENNTGI